LYLVLRAAIECIKAHFLLCQILSSLGIVVPLGLLVDMFATGIASLACPPPSHTDIPAHPLQAPAPPDAPLTPPPPLSPPPPTSPRAFTFDFMDEELGAGAENVKNVTCFVMMLDLVLVQVRTTGIGNHAVKGKISVIYAAISNDKFL
jgi:hypothetical protein